MTSVNVNGASFEYSERGRGEPLVLVHGSASDYRTWGDQHELLGRSFRTVAYSRRYHWPNREIAEGTDYSMMEHVDDLGALLRSLELAPAHLVGHSYGAFLCLLLAIRDPGLVRTLVLCEPPTVTLFVGMPPKPREILGLLATRPRTALAIMKLGARGMAPAARAFRRGDPQAGIRIFASAVFGPGGYDRLSESRKAQVQDNASNVQAELLGSGFAALDAGDVRAVRNPALLVTGENSIALFHRLTDRLEELMPNTDRVEVPGASHMMHEDNAPAFNSLVLRFLADRGGAVHPPLRKASETRASGATASD